MDITFNDAPRILATADTATVNVNFARAANDGKREAINDLSNLRHGFSIVVFRQSGSKDLNAVVRNVLHYAVLEGGNFRMRQL